METVLQIMSLAVLGAVIAVLIRQKAGTMAICLSLAVCVSAFLFSLQFFAPILEFTERLRSLSGLNSAVTAPLLKVTALGILAQVSGSVCEDAGESSLGKTVEVCAAVFAVYVSLPLMTAVLELLESVLGG